MSTNIFRGGQVLKTTTIIWDKWDKQKHLWEHRELNKWICQTSYRIHEVFLVVLKWYWIIFRWFLAVLVTGMLGVLSVLLLALVEFVAYYSDQTDGEILKPYNGRYKCWACLKNSLSSLIYSVQCSVPLKRLRYEKVKGKLIEKNVDNQYIWNLSKNTSLRNCFYWCCSV